MEANVFVSPFPFPWPLDGLAVFRFLGEDALSRDGPALLLPALSSARGRALFLLSSTTQGRDKT